VIAARLQKPPIPVLRGTIKSLPNASIAAAPKPVDIKTQSTSVVPELPTKRSRAADTGVFRIWVRAVD
jgi:hypothetical protein